MVDNVTTLPSMFATIYGMNELSKKRLGTQENILISLRFFYVYYYKKYKRTFDHDFLQMKYNVSYFIKELDGFFTYLLGQQHLNDEPDIIGLGFFHSEISKANKLTYGNHVRNVGKFLKYLNYRYMNVAFQDMSPMEAHKIYDANVVTLADKIKVLNKVEVSKIEPAHRYKSVTEQQSIELTNMLIPSTPEFVDAETGELFEAVVNPQNPFSDGFEQYRNYLIHRLMFNYGLRVGEVLLLMKDSVGASLPDSKGNVRFLVTVQNLPDDLDDPRKKRPSVKTVHSYRQIELTKDDYIMMTIFIEQYRDPLFEKKRKVDHNILFIKGTGKLSPLSYDAILTFYKKKIDPTFIALYPYYRTKRNKNIDYLVNITPHVGRHTWAYITLEFIYNSLLKESVMLTHDYGIRARMNGVLEPAVEQLRTLGGWSITSTVPLMYAKRFLEMVSNQSNQKRTKRADWQTAIPERAVSQNEAESTFNVLEETEYDEDFTFDDLFN
ncbi:site-specific integrase [Vibrio parahaemolyticus]|uniref:site-specific integrase n=1 Tax=Vibrio parahaemolyticus TaxID=670 RepID=UPI00192CEF69|nr:site-specific integrase [Vibrio parahaemolyticus]ELF6478680.1 site-specific integrase [Vibrio fluvialis]EII3441095.1 site-specific integrase [Vibrio parahaemolyticus]EJG0499232.1 site-specific integrase [Vibrio parahaemolyticus]EJG1975814.1 site-specific integrase [Vibrio parahaemolyticus]EJG1984893.1 site-specific integrase [Vibrio parahaemolyticus]